MQLTIDNRGEGKLGLILFLLVLGSGVFLAFRVLPFYYYYYEIQGLMESQAAKASVFTDDQIRKRLMKRIKELEIPLDKDQDLQINRLGNKIIIEMYYEEYLSVEFGEDTYDLHTFVFNPRVERPM